MATAHPLLAPATEPPHEAAAGAAAAAAEPEPVPREEDKSIVLNGAMARLPVELEVALPVRDFRVRNLLALEPGQVIETEWALGEDMPLSSGLAQLAWSEFEVIDSQLGVRVTRLM
jgi:flagellar motor switch protein FliN/FliY